MLLKQSPQFVIAEKKIPYILGLAYLIFKNISHNRVVWSQPTNLQMSSAQ